MILRLCEYYHYGIENFVVHLFQTPMLVKAIKSGDVRVRIDLPIYGWKMDDE